MVLFLFIIATAFRRRSHYPHRSRNRSRFSPQTRHRRANASDRRSRTRCSYTSSTPMRCTITRTIKSLRPNRGHRRRRRIIRTRSFFRHVANGRRNNSIQAIFMMRRAYGTRQSRGPRSQPHQHFNRTSQLIATINRRIRSRHTRHRHRRCDSNRQKRARIDGFRDIHSLGFGIYQKWTRLGTGRTTSNLFLIVRVTVQNTSNTNGAGRRTADTVLTLCFTSGFRDFNLTSLRIRFRLTTDIIRRFSSINRIRRFRF